MVSRLDKLYDLLENNNTSIRTAAVAQIGQLTCNSNVELSILLKKLLPYIQHKAWPVRISAAEVIKRIGSNVKPWIPNRSSTNSSNHTAVENMISLENLNLIKVLEIGSRLYSFDESDMTNAGSSSINKEEINKHLGIILPESEMHELITKEDCENFFPTKKCQTMKIEDAIKTSLVKTEKSVGKAMKRQPSEESGPAYKLLKTEETEDTAETSVEDNYVEWPWNQFCEEMLVGLWHPKWEVRHGCATVLRELARTQGAVMVANSWTNDGKYDFKKHHASFLEDVVGRLLCTLTLDQVSDFVSDEMVAPVRESCAQAIGVVSVHLQTHQIEATYRQLLSLLKHPKWTVCHGALLGLKYLLAARLDLVSSLVPVLYTPIAGFLSPSSNHQDNKENDDDDVRCAAASALMPLFSGGVQLIGQMIDTCNLRHNLWLVLAQRSDHMSLAATGAVLQLLQRLYNHDQQQDTSVVESASELAANLHRLHLCYFSYGDAIRLAAIQTCSVLLRHSQTRLSELSAPVIYQVLNQLFQRVLVDDSEDVMEAAESVWQWLVSQLTCDILAQSCLEHFNVWLCSAMQPGRVPFSSGMITKVSVPPLPAPINNSDDDSNKFVASSDYYIGGRHSFLAEGDNNVREEVVLQARVALCRCLASLCQALCAHPLLAKHILVDLFVHVHLREKLALQRFVVACLLAHTPSPVCELPNEVGEALRQQLSHCLTEPLYYQEILPIYRQMLGCCRELSAAYVAHGVTAPEAATGPGNGGGSMTLPQCLALVAEQPTKELLEAAGANAAESVVNNARSAVEQTVQQQQALARLVEVAAGRALLTWNWLPLKMTPLIRPMMDAVRLDWRRTLQLEAARGIGHLLLHKSAANPSVFGKVVRNLGTAYSEAVEAACPGDDDVMCLIKVNQLGKDIYPAQETTVASSNGEEENWHMKLSGCGAVWAELCRGIEVGHYEAPLAVIVEAIYEEPLRLLVQLPEDAKSGGRLLAGLRTMEACVAALPMLKCDLMPLAEALFERGLRATGSSLRHWSARVLARLLMPSGSVSEVTRSLVDQFLLDKSVYVLKSLSHSHHCLGVIELLYLVMHRGVLAYRLSLLVSVLPVVLRATNASHDPLRKTATLLFSHLLTLLPLEQSCADLSILSPARAAQRLSDRAFIEGLLRPESIPEYEHTSDCLTVPLRHYQQRGLNWLGFLARYGLHGILADDMGLGKTLQTLCVIVGEARRIGNTDARPSLVVCPATLTRHWQQEAARYIQSDFQAVIYAGSADVRQAMVRSGVLEHSQLVITSYEVLRNDTEALMRPGGLGTWSYLVLDEGHLIRNHKSKLAVAAKSVVARHRLVLTGTPIQNRVSELWSLFDFLMPGLLGASHTVFQRKYGRYISQTSLSATAVSTSSVPVPGDIDQTPELVGIESLHKQVQPFMLRRLKEDVLSELPPKIIQDYVCTMSAVQSRLYAAYLRSQTSDDPVLHLHEAAADTPEEKAALQPDQKQHVFQALHYLRSLCNHPCLVLTQQHPLRTAIMQDLRAANRSLRDVELSGKLLALKQLMLDCGIGTEDQASSGASSGSGGDTSLTVVSSHRILIFCQTKAMLSLVQNMMETQLSKASYLRLDGSVSIKDRQNIVDKFNEDPSVDALLLTTAVGGLGLSLTSANTVIFVEHDWNPMKDLQAMDRAHRLGQRRTVNVYRLVTADTVEERIMGIQRFKLALASNLVRSSGLADAAPVSNMTSLMEARAQDSQVTTVSAKADPDDVADEYGQEFCLDKFVQSL